jgi:acetyl-CoA carboxylase carboxyltransferase component/biotin carboxyl carrier protein
MRPVLSADELAGAYERCASEARAAFGSGELYVEQLLRRARHIEVQVVGDGQGGVVHLGERDCSLQRRRQKLIEMAPAPHLDEATRGRLTEHAMALAGAASYLSLGTVEFLVDADHPDTIAFLETNARIQVEHTVTEEVTGVDLVTTQLRLAGGATLADVGLADGPLAPRGAAVQARVNLETMAPDGTTRPTGGTLTAFDVPSGFGVRTDTYGYTGYTTSPSFDSLLAKVVGFAPSGDIAAAAAKVERALSEFRIEGMATNIGFLRAILGHHGAVGAVTTFVEEHVADLAAEAEHLRPRSAAAPAAGPTLAGARVDPDDPLAVLAHGKSGRPAGDAMRAPAAQAGPAAGVVIAPEGTVPVPAPLQGTIVTIEVAVGDLIPVGRALLVMESMKMEHVITAGTSGVLRELVVKVGDAVFEGHPLAFIEEAEVEFGEAHAEAEIDLDHIRPDLAEVVERHELGLDHRRPKAVERRRRTGQRTARENVDQLCDAGTFVEYGPLVIAAQRSRRDLQDLIENTPADGMLAGIASVNGHLFDAQAAKTVVMAYDYTVLAGTQGQKNHLKKDRMMEIAEQWRLPVVFFAEGGGGRPGDTDWISPAGLDIPTFNTWGRLSGLVPMVGITSGRCFAGNAVILGCCDVIIATEGSNIGLGGPAMIEGGGLGVFTPEEVGPLDVQIPNGVVDIAVKDEVEAVEAAKKYLSYFQGRTSGWECADQRLLRHVVPENRLRVYDVREVIETLCDTGSVLELRPHFGHGMVTALARIEGHPIGILANNPHHLGGAVDSAAADKGARFMQLCDAHEIPLLSLCDTPGNMVGPEVEKEALVRHACRMFVVGANVTVPFVTIVVRKAYGLGAQGMAGGSFKTPTFVISWPTGEFGGMGLEGAVKLGFRKELEAQEDPAERRALYERLVARMYENGKAVNTASHFEIDGVIDPADSRRWIIAALDAAQARPVERREGKKRPFVDTW